MTPSFSTRSRSIARSPQYSRIIKPDFQANYYYYYCCRKSADSSPRPPPPLPPNWPADSATPRNHWATAIWTRRPSSPAPTDASRYRPPRSADFPRHPFPVISGWECPGTSSRRDSSPGAVTPPSGTLRLGSANTTTHSPLDRPARIPSRRTPHFLHPCRYDRGSQWRRRRSERTDAGNGN